MSRPRRPAATLAVRGVLLLTLLGGLTGCAVFEEENRRLLNAMDASLAPASDGGRWAAAPLAFPAGLVAGVLDAVIVHPATAVDDAWGDTVDWLWTPTDESRLRRAVLTPFMAAFTPPVFLGSWLGRSLLPIPPRDDAGGDGGDATPGTEDDR